MKSFDRRSFGKMLLGAIPAVFLAKRAVAEAERGGFTKEDLKKCETLARKPFEEGRWGTRNLETYRAAVNIHPYDMQAVLSDVSFDGYGDVIRLWSREGSLLVIDGTRYNVTTCVAPKTESGLAALKEDSKWRMVL